MAIAGTLAVNIIAKTEKFVKGMTKARKSLKGFKGETEKASQSFGVFSRSLAAIVAPAVIGRMIFQTAKASDELAKMSLRLGFNVEQLQFWQFSAQRSGVALNTLTMAIQRMERRIGEAAVGTGEAQGALKDLNIDAKAFVELDAHVQFEKIMEATRGITNQNEKLRIFFKLFDSEGVALSQMTGDIAEMREEFERLGGATSKEGLAKATKFIDAMTNLKQASGKAVERIVIDIAPAAAESMGFLTRQMEKARNFRAERHDRIVRHLTPPSRGLGLAAGDDARQRAFRDPRPSQAPSGGEFGRIGRSVVGQSGGFQKGPDVLSRFVRSQKDKDRIAKQHLEVDKEAKDINAATFTLWEKFTNDFNNRMDAFQRIGEAQF